jgi:phenylalanyl-tRNA synthetase beta chain
MKISIQWLRDWVDVDDDIGAFAHVLTMAGLEVEGNQPAGPQLPGVIVAEVTSVERHPDAEKLHVCRVNTGSETVQIVCGATNVRAGMKAALAQIGATLPDGTQIKKAKLRNVDSFGMLCSARELGLSEDSAGLIELPETCTLGASVVDALALNDRILEINLTPNRGDCMSIAGVAREAAAISGKVLHPPTIKPVREQIDDRFPVTLAATQACTRFAGRVIRGIKADQPSPWWLRERLRRAGLRPISLLVDVTNYVMLELGQPMHAYDLSKLHGGITARMARTGETLALLDGRTIPLADDILVIADQQSVLGMAGVMGGEASGIGSGTTDVFLEAAHFVPDAIAGRGRRFGIVTDASQRFERGVDPLLPSLAIEHATQLIAEYGGGTPGPAELAGLAVQASPPIALRYERVMKVLGVELLIEDVGTHLQRLGMQVQQDGAALAVTPPSWRFDIKIEEDLIEEVGRLHGYNNIPAVDADIAQQLGRQTEAAISSERAADLLIDRGYQEAITYSFIDPQWQELFSPGQTSRKLLNPISAELADMRLSLWPGLALAARDNLRRQQSRVRLFEVGRCYTADSEVEVVAGLALGSAFAEQWDIPQRKIDFYDVKADIETALRLSNQGQAFTFSVATHPALHPGQTARILRGSTPVGWLGALHPDVTKKMDLTYPTYVFELSVQAALAARLPESVDISRFPSIRRDLAVIVDEPIQFDALALVVRDAAGALLQDISVLSVYRGPQLDKGKKSIALGLHLQDTSRTLTDQDADRVITQVIHQIGNKLGGGIRDK